MKPRDSLPATGADAEVAALIATLHQTEQRLAELTAGEVDTVSDHDGRMLLLRHSQEQLRHSEAAKHAAVVESLRASESRFRSLTELSSDWFWEQDEAYRFVKFSGGDRVDGWGPDQDKAVGVTRWDLPTIEALSQSWDEHKALLRERKPFRNFEYRRVLASGVLQYVAASGEPIFDAGGGFTGYRGVATDITGRVEKEKKLKESESRFRQMAENISDVFFLQNLDGSQIYYVSPAYEAIWGRTCESLYANPASWSDAIHPDDLDRALGRSNDREFRIVRPDGGVRWVHAREFPILDDAGTTYRTAGVASDITERRQADEVLKKRAAELERFHRLSVGRELQMIELKKQVNDLAARAGHKPPHDLAFLGPQDVKTDPGHEQTS